MSESHEETYGPLYPLVEGAEQLGVPLNTLRGWIQKGLIESHKLFGRRLISEEEILRLREASRIPARSETRPQVNIDSALARIRELEARLAEAERQISRLFDAANHAKNDCVNAECYVCAAEAENARLRGALEMVLKDWRFDSGDTIEGTTSWLQAQAALSPEQPEPQEGGNE